MKYILSILLSAILIQASFAQGSKTCNDPAVMGQSNNIKSVYEKQGMVVFRESMIAMQSMEPSPIAVRLQADITYQFIFIGSSQANRLSLELYDGTDKKLDEKVEKGGDYLLYTFKPEKTDLYLINLYQKKGARDLCGYFGIMTQQLKNAPPKLAPIRSTQKANTVPVQTRPVKQTPVKTKQAATAPVYQTKPVKQSVQSTTKKVPVVNQQTTKQTTESQQKTTPSKNTPIPVKSIPSTANKIPDNQKPNPNRTRATKEYQQQQSEQ